MRLNLVGSLRYLFEFGMGFFVAGIFLIGCANDKPEVMPKDNTPPTCDTVSVTYSLTVKPIIQAACLDAGCHCPTCPQPGGFANWNTYSGLFEYAGDSLRKLMLLQKIKHEGSAPYMPLDAAKLSDCEIAKIQQWINLGAPNN